MMAIVLVQPKGHSPRKRSDESQACGGSVSTTSIGTYMATLKVCCVRAWWAARVTGATPRLILRVRLCAPHVHRVLEEEAEQDKDAEVNYFSVQAEPSRLPPRHFCSVCGCRFPSPPSHNGPCVRSANRGRADTSPTTRAPSAGRGSVACDARPPTRNTAARSSKFEFKLNARCGQGMEFLCISFSVVKRKRKEIGCYLSNGRDARDQRAAKAPVLLLGVDARYVPLPSIL
jgi:hypothetical protein